MQSTQKSLKMLQVIKLFCCISVTYYTHHGNLTRFIMIKLKIFKYSVVVTKEYSDIKITY